MIPNSAEYFVCQNSEEYKLCHAMLRRNGIEGKYEFAYPTVFAVRDDKVIGVLARHKSDRIVIVGTLALDNSLSIMAKGIIAMRLGECLDIVMKSHGMEHYWIAAASDNRQLQQSIEKVFQVKPESFNEHDIFYKRSLAA